MCSRFTQTVIGPLLEELVRGTMGSPLAEDNILPSEEAVAVRHRSGEAPEVLRMRFGWPAAPGRRGLLLNARAETVRRLPTFREAFRLRRAIVPADGFYEWSGPKGDRRSWLIRRRDRRPFPIAALWDVRTPGAPPAFVLITTIPNEVVGAIHDRMPLILPEGMAPLWLDPAMPDPPLEAWARPPRSGDWEALPVSLRGSRTDLGLPSLWDPDPENPSLP